ncbi:MAG: hypothetical protein AB1666_01900 [Pseudomonadota bacterium]|uniref:MobA-like NTP transferase domain-containing protein n=1 Tax=Caldimonas aquatica TaxID=376175 RepID=A0ABY6MV75_9BURK|nr:hypothetical protein [Schlegelella aquatica]UZD55907.1 hypothetical protein OMP39_04830 [Schlegelella aquatica]
MEHGWWRAWGRWWPGGCVSERRPLETIVMPLASAQGGLPVEFWPLHGRPLLWHALREAGEAGGRRVILVADESVLRWRALLRELTTQAGPELQVRIVRAARPGWLGALVAARPHLRRQPFAVLVPSLAAPQPQAPLVRLAEQFRRLRSSILCVPAHDRGGVCVELASPDAPLCRVRAAYPDPPHGLGHGPRVRAERAIFTPAIWDALDRASLPHRTLHETGEADLVSALLQQELVFAFRLTQPLYDVRDAAQWVELQSLGLAIERRAASHFLPQTAPRLCGEAPPERQAVGGAPIVPAGTRGRARLILVHSRR